MDNIGQRISDEINALANQLRALRVSGADKAHVSAIEERLRSRWADLRAHRAGGRASEPIERRHGRW